MGLDSVIGLLVSVAMLVYLVMAAVIKLQLDWRRALLVLAFAPLPAGIAARAGSEQAERELEITPDVEHFLSFIRASERGVTV